MGTLLVVINPPSVDRLDSLRQILEPVLVGAFLPQPTIERLDEGVRNVLRHARRNSPRRHLARLIGPIYLWSL